MAESESIRKKIYKVIDGHIGIESTDALKVISNLCITNTTNSRRTLKHDLEKRDLLTTKSIMQDFGKVRDELDKVCSALNSMNDAVENMSARLENSKQKTRHLIEQTSKLRSEEKKVDQKLSLVEAFVKHFEISSEDLKILHGTTKDAPIALEFFAVLAHVEKLYDDCKILIRSGFETAALDIMEKMGLHQEAAIERLYRWTLSACRNMDLPTNTLVPKAMSKLQNRQVLFVNVIEEYCTSRKSSIVRSFIDVLTQGTDTGSKPIEFYANDPKRYIEDILTWVYQVIPIEKESLNLLLKECNEIDKSKEITNALVCIMDAVCPPLKVRAELILKPDKDPIVLCAVSNLIRYYKNTILETLTSGLLIDTLDELLKTSEDAFIMSLDSKIQRELSHGVKAPPSDLSPSAIVTDLLAFLREILSVSKVSDVSDNSNVKVIVSHVLDPLLHAINATACHLSLTDMAVYLLNCLYHIQCTLSLYQNMEERTERLQAQSDAQLDTLTSEQASSLVANLNMSPIYSILQDPFKGPMSAIPGMDTSTLKTFLNKFDMFVASQDQYILPQLDLLLSRNYKNSVKSRAFGVIFAIYKQLYEAVHDPSNNYSEPQLLMRKSPQDLSSLLNVQQQ